MRRRLASEVRDVTLEACGHGYRAAASGVHCVGCCCSWRSSAAAARRRRGPSIRSRPGQPVASRRCPRRLPPRQVRSGSLTAWCRPRSPRWEFGFRGTGSSLTHLASTTSPRWWRANRGPGSARSYRAGSRVLWTSDRFLSIPGSSGEEAPSPPPESLERPPPTRRKGRDYPGTCGIRRRGVRPSGPDGRGAARRCARLGERARPTRGVSRSSASS